MSEGVNNLYTSFVLGMSVTWLAIEIVRRMPLDDYFKVFLMVVLPLPAVLMGLVMMNYGPESFRESAVAQTAPKELVKSFFTGAFVIIVALGLFQTYLTMRDEEM